MVINNNGIMNNRKAINKDNKIVVGSIFGPPYLSVGSAVSLVQAVEWCEADVTIECRGVRCSIDNVLGLISLDIRHGDFLLVAAEGLEKREAMDKVLAIIEGGADMTDHYNEMLSLVDLPGGRRS